MSKFGYRNAAQRKKNLRYGGYATVVTLIALVVLIVATVLLEQLDLTVDLSSNKMYTPSSQTMEILDSLEDDVEIYGLYSTGVEEGAYYASVLRLMEQYGRLCDKVTYTTIDTLKNPNFVKEDIDSDTSATTVADGSVIVKNTRTGKYRLLGIMDFYSYTSSDSKYIDEFCAEEALTTAVRYVTSERTPVLYQLMGHGEAELDSTFKSYLKTTNYDFSLLNLAAPEDESWTKAIPVTLYTSILINNPKTDLKDEEYELLLDYMERGGRMLVLLDYETPNMLPNFNRLLARYGLSYQAGGSYIEETAYSNYYQTSFTILPKKGEEHAITSEMTSPNEYVMMVHAVPIQVADSVQRNTEITRFLTTSDSAVLNGEQTQGTYNLGVVVSEQTSRGQDIAETKLVVIGSSSFVDYTHNKNYITTGNYKLIASTLNYLQDEVSSVYITSKSLTAGKIQTSLNSFVVGFGVFAIALPLACVITGLVIWLRRRHL